MSSFTRATLLGPILAMLVCGGALRAQEAAVAPRDSLLWIQHLVQIAFPELKGRECRLSLAIATQLDSDWSGVGLINLTVYPAESARPARPLLEGRFNAIPGSESVWFEGDLVSDAAMDAVKKEAESHPEWTEADLQSLLRRAGAEFPGERTSFIRHLNIDRFAPLLGTFEVMDIDFLWRGPTDLPESLRKVAMHWVVRVRTTATARRSRGYLLTFEPMHGRLTSLRDLYVK
jgi:hypothetical protein